MDTPPDFSSEVVKAAMAAEQAEWNARQVEIPLPSFDASSFRSSVTPRELPTVSNFKPRTAPVATNPFKLIKASPTTIRVVISTIDGVIPDFPLADTAFSAGDSPHCIFTPATDTGYLCAQIVTDGTATITARRLGFAATVPANDATHFYFQIGSWIRDATTHKITSVSNTAYGPITACRNWFSNPVIYGFDAE
ncbi:MAG: hypothetical protein WCL08_00340 [Verrucomicrobiota bacterium]